MDELFKKAPDELSADEAKSVIEVYKMLVDMADKVSQRRQNANNFYLSVNTALIGASAYISSLSQKTPAHVLAISVAGALVCLLWMRNIQSYKDLNAGKFSVIQAIEKRLPVAPFTAEWTYLERGLNAKKYRPFHSVEVLVPVVFITVHVFQLLRSIPWARLCAVMQSIAL